MSLLPSIGNWSLPCQSHNWITDNRVRFAAEMSPAMIAGVKARDRRDAQLLAHKPERWLGRIGRISAEAWTKFKELVSIWWR